MGEKIRVRVWDECTAPKSVYPEGIHGAIVNFLNKAGDISAVSATLQDPEQGLGQADLDATDVLMWWGHNKHGEVKDEYVDRVLARVDQGMGFIGLHSAHWSKPFKRLLNASADISGWREQGEWEKLQVKSPNHPIMLGVTDFQLNQTEMYKEPFDVPEPDDLLLFSTFQGGETFRSGLTWTRGRGRIFYFRPGHETYLIFLEPVAQKILIQAARWAAGK